MPLAAKAHKGSTSGNGEWTLLASTIRLMNELAQIMLDEDGLLRARKIDEHRELLKRKQKAALEYRANMKSISTDPDMLKRAPADLRAAARAAGQKLADVSDRNAKLLRGSITAVERLLRDVVRMIKDKTLKPVAYANSKTAHMQLGTYSPTCKPVTVNRTA
jgi:hypothetical protein